MSVILVLEKHPIRAPYPINQYSCWTFMTIRPGLYLNAKPVKLSGILIEGIITLSECKTCKMVWYLDRGIRSLSEYQKPQSNCIKPPQDSYKLLEFKPLGINAKGCFTRTRKTSNQSTLSNKSIFLLDHFGVRNSRWKVSLPQDLISLSGYERTLLLLKRILRRVIRCVSLVEQ
jgi:hypothetical protein